MRDMVKAILPHFDTLSVPSTGITVGKNEFENNLQGMYDANEGDGGLIFAKRKWAASALPTPLVERNPMACADEDLFCFHRLIRNMISRGDPTP